MDKRHYHNFVISLLPYFIPKGVVWPPTHLQNRTNVAAIRDGMMKMRAIWRACLAYAAAFQNANLRHLVKPAFLSVCLGVRVRETAPSNSGRGEQMRGLSGTSPPGPTHLFFLLPSKGALWAVIRSQEGMDGTPNARTYT